VVDRAKVWALVAGAVVAALLAGSGLMLPAEAEGNCGAGCTHSYNQCRIKTKGSSSCDKQYSSCLQGCRR
jgi:hypothetical protein